MVRSLEEDKERLALLEAQLVFVGYEGRSEMIRPEALALIGVDSMSTDEIDQFVKLCIGDRSLDFKIEWVNDTMAVVAFLTHDACIEARSCLIGKDLSTPPKELSDPEYTASLMVESDTLPLPAKAEAEEGSVPAVLRLRQALQTDKKMKNANVYSRYYLLHGEPDRQRRRKERAGRGGSDRNPETQDSVEEPVAVEEDGADLFPERLDNAKPYEQEVDLFAERLQKRLQRGRSARNRSPRRHRLRSPLRNASTGSRLRSPVRTMSQERDRLRSPMAVDRD